MNPSSAEDIKRMLTLSKIGTNKETISSYCTGDEIKVGQDNGKKTKKENKCMG